MTIDEILDKGNNIGPTLLASIPNHKNSMY